MNEQAHTTRARRVLSAIMGVWGGLALLVLIVMIGMRLSGAQFNVVQTASMTPTLPIDTLTVTRPVDPGTITVDDVIMFSNRDGELVMHRVTEVLDHAGVRRFRTKGDANRTADTQLVHEKNVTGLLSAAVPNVGAFARSVQSPVGFVYLALFMAPLLAWAWGGRPPSTRQPLAMVVTPSGAVVCPSWLEI